MKSVFVVVVVARTGTKKRGPLDKYSRSEVIVTIEAARVRVWMVVTAEWGWREEDPAERDGRDGENETKFSTPTGRVSYPSLVLSILSNRKKAESFSLAHFTSFRSCRRWSIQRRTVFYLFGFGGGRKRERR